MLHSELALLWREMHSDETDTVVEETSEDVLFHAATAPCVRLLHPEKTELPSPPEFWLKPKAKTKSMSEWADFHPEAAPPFHADRLSLHSFSSLENAFSQTWVAEAWPVRGD